MVYLPRDNAVAFQLPQLLREHLLGGVGQRFSQFTKPPCAFEQVVNDDRLPFTANDAQRIANRTFPQAHSFKKVSTIQNSAYLLV